MTLKCSTLHTKPISQQVRERSDCPVTTDSDLTSASLRACSRFLCRICSSILASSLAAASFEAFSL